MVYQPAKYLNLKSQFKAIEERLAQDLTSSSTNSTKKLLALHAQVQDFFQTQILDNPDPHEAGETQVDEELILSHYVEINKQLRLLGADLTMLHAARNPDTFVQRQQQASDRLNMLISYCSALLQIDSQS
ncbi:heterocyst frequency control protein PatD [Pseudanabaena sp. PCC 6802]|uniref:heterocyst frequency control protein PatD n=1 Tax=Pseudanabaena sp. PCC 6802 TaxID=118173 RepID=UPI00034A5C73|nr:heterocyst frequency control protein PatD [Pseudanabaena sp. PCC 6802]